MKDLTPKETAEKLKISVKTINVWLKKGLFPNARQLPGIKVGRGEAWLIPESDAEKLRDYRPKRGKPFSGSPSLKALEKRNYRKSFPK